MDFDPISFFGEFLAALQHAEAGARLYEMHTPDALVRTAAGLRRAEHTDAGQFAAAHREINTRCAGTLPRFSRPTLLHRSEDGSEDATVCWFEIMEEREERPMLAAIGIRAAATQPRIGWATVAGYVRDWSYAEGNLQSIADYPWMRESVGVCARALIDAAYFRQFWRPPVKFRSLPDARFVCQMSTVCCKHDFEIALPPEAQLLVDAIPWQKLRPELKGTQLTPRADGNLQLKALNETCRFLGPLGYCQIHQAIGRQPFGACCVFPVAFAHTPEGVDVALSPICDGVRRGIGPLLMEREENLRERLIHSEPRRTTGFRLAPGIEIPWENFRDIEKGLCDVLAAEDLPLRRRLYLGCRLLSSLRDNEGVYIEQWLAEPPVAITTDLRRAIHEMLGRILEWDRAVLRNLPKAIPANLPEAEVRDPKIVTGILQNTLFSKTYSYPFDLTTAHNFLVVLYLLALLMQESASSPMTELMWRELGSLGVHGLLKSVLHEAVPEGFRDVFGKAEFGMWMLSA